MLFRFAECSLFLICIFVILVISRFGFVCTNFDFDCISSWSLLTCTFYFIKLGSQNECVLSMMGSLI